ncbi:hypothetical protein ABK040_015138 [Willaertia magna]
MTDKIKINYELSYKGSIKLVNLYVDNLTSQYTYCKINFTKENIWGSSDGVPKEYQIFLYPEKKHVYLTSFPIENKYKAWKYNYTFKYYSVPKPLEVKEVFENVFFESFHLSCGCILTCIRNNSSSPHIQVKIDYTTLNNLTPSKTYNDYVDVHDLKILQELRITDSTKDALYRMKYFSRKIENSPMNLSTISYYTPDLAQFDVVVERRELCPGVTAVLSLNNEEQAILRVENDSDVAVAINDIKVQGGSSVTMTNSENVVQCDLTNSFFVLPNQRNQEVLRVKLTTGQFNLQYDCKVMKGTVIENNAATNYLTIQGHYFSSLKRCLLAVKNSGLSIPIKCSLFMKVLENSENVSKYSDSNPIIVPPASSSIYSIIVQRDKTKGMSYKYTYKVTKVGEETKIETNTPITPKPQPTNEPKETSDVNHLVDCMESLSISDDVSKIINSNSLYTDKDFPATITSVYPSEHKESKMDISFKRASEILGDNFSIFCDGIEPDDIVQGSLGDCWFLSALASLASIPNLIENLFITKTANKSGIYEVQLCLGGEFRRIVVDDYFPTTSWGSTIFSHNHSNELWVMLLEKAYSKVCGAYINLTSGYADSAFEDLSGFPVDSISVGEKTQVNELWNTLISFVDKKYLMCCCTGTGPKYEKVGIVDGHFYTLLWCKEAMGERLIKLRNPWGGGVEWNGRFSDSDSAWTPKMKQAFDYLEANNTNDGVFFMPIEDFVKYFVSISICKYNPAYVRKSIQVPVGDSKSLDDKDYPIVELNLPFDEESCIIGIHQKDPRHKDCPKNPSGLSFVILEKSSQKVVGGVSMSSNKTNYTGELKLKAGTYHIVPAIHVRDNPKYFVVSIHSTNNSSLSLLPACQHDQSIKQIYSKAAVSFGKAQLTKFVNVYTWGTSIAFGTSSNSPVTICNFTINAKNMVNAAINSNFKVSNDTPDMAWIGYQNVPKQGFSYSTNYSYLY